MNNLNISRHTHPKLFKTVAKVKGARTAARLVKSLQCIGEYRVSDVSDLSCSIIFKDTLQGHDFWWNIYRRSMHY